MGKWRGTVRVGGVETESMFEVFECQGAFEVIFGKPWLRQVKGTHEYETDTIRIRVPAADQIITLTNEDALPTTMPVSMIQQTKANLTSKPQSSKNRWETLTSTDVNNDKTEVDIEKPVETSIKRLKKQEHRWKAQLSRWGEACQLRKDLWILEETVMADAIRRADKEQDGPYIPLSLLSTQDSSNCTDDQSQTTKSKNNHDQRQQSTRLTNRLKYLVMKMGELKMMMDEGEEAIAQELGKPTTHKVHALPVGDVTTEEFKID
jgi:hypothetical protein